MTDRSKQQRIKDPITVDDYRLLAKALKLKILKQTKIIEELEADIKQKGIQNEKLRKQPLSSNKQTPKPSPDVKIDTLNGKKQVINTFKENVQKFGISTEAIYRIIDVECQAEVDSDTFRKGLSKINLNLNPKQISCLIYIFDENCTGTITRQQFTDALQAYQVSSAENEHVSYMNNSLNKLANLINRSKTSLKKFYDQMEGKSKKPVSLDAFGQYIKSVFPEQIQEKQIVAAFNQIDLENNSIVDRQNFIYGVQSSLNKQSNMKKSNEEFNDPSRRPSKIVDNNIDSNISYGQSFPKLPVGDILLQQYKQSVIHVKVPVNQINIDDLFQKYLEEYKLDINKIYEELTLLPMKSRMTLYSFKKAINTSAKVRSNTSQVNPQSITSLFKLIDIHQKGSIGFGELIHFHLQYGTDFSIIFRLIGKYFKNNGLNSQSFFFMFGINADADISKNKFLEILGKTFNSIQEQVELWEKVWNHFDTTQKGILPVSYLIKELSKYEIQQ